MQKTLGQTGQRSGTLDKEFARDEFQIRIGKAPRRRARKRPPGRPTAKQATELRESVLYAALSAFMERGFEAASIEGIARSAKVAKITLYRQFGTKEELFHEVTRHAQARVRQNLQAFLNPDEHVSEDVVREIIVRIHEALTHPEYLAVLRMVIAEAERFPQVARAMLKDTDFVFQPLISYLQELRDSGRITIDDPRDAAIQLAALAGGGARYLMVKPSNDPKISEHWTEPLVTLFSRAWQLRPPQTQVAATAGRSARKRS